MTRFFSKSTGVFYDDRLHAEIPQDAVRFLSDDDYRAAHCAISAGGSFDFSESGGVIVVPPEAESVGGLLERVKAGIRVTRAPMLDALTGIAGRAQRAGNTDLATEADALAVALLDITDDPALNAAQSLEDMQAAGVAAYRAIASTASAELAVVFKEITGA